MSSSTDVLTSLSLTKKGALMVGTLLSMARIFVSTSWRVVLSTSSRVFTRHWRCITMTRWTSWWRQIPVLRHLSGWVNWTNKINPSINCITWPIDRSYLYAKSLNPPFPSSHSLYPVSRELCAMLGKTTRTWLDLWRALVCHCHSCNTCTCSSGAHAKWVVTITQHCVSIGTIANLLSSILTILLTRPNNDTVLCYSNDPFLTVYSYMNVHLALGNKSLLFTYGHVYVCMIIICM